MTALMKCGHAAQGTTANGDPVCVVCVGITPGAREVDGSPPDLSPRLAKCSYDNGRGPHVGHDGGRPVEGPVPSTDRLPFFKHSPDQPFDSYYCGCWGWD